MLDGLIAAPDHKAIGALHKFVQTDRVAFAFQEQRGAGERGIVGAVQKLGNKRISEFDLGKPTRGQAKDIAIPGQKRKDEGEQVVDRDIGRGHVEHDAPP